MIKEKIRMVGMCLPIIASMCFHQSANGMENQRVLYLQNLTSVGTAVVENGLGHLPTLFVDRANLIDFVFNIGAQLYAWLRLMH